MITETLAAAARLADLCIAADLVCGDQPGLLFEAVQARRGLARGLSWILDQIFPADRAAPMVTVLDGHPHTLAFRTGINHARGAALSVSKFGQVGSLDEIYHHYHGIDTDTIVRTALNLADQARKIAT